RLSSFRTSRARSYLTVIWERIMRGARTISSLGGPCAAVTSTECPAPTVPFSQHLPRVGPTTQTKEAVREAAGYRRRQWISTAPRSFLGSESQAVTFRQSFPTLDDLPPPTWDSCNPSLNHRLNCCPASAQIGFSQSGLW